MDTIYTPVLQAEAASANDATRPQPTEESFTPLLPPETASVTAGSLRPRQNGHGQADASSQIAASSYEAPSEEEDVRKISTIRFTTLAADAASTSLPLAIMIFLLAVWHLEDNIVVNSTLEFYENAIRVLASAFPILFAAIMGRLMAATARCKLEKGCEMGRLEQILGSRTVGSTFLTALELRSFTALSAALVFIWAFSPIGTQSVLRMLSTRVSYNLTDANLTYFDTKAQSSRVGLIMDAGMTKSSDSTISVTTLKYAARVMVPNSSMLSAMDLWGNLKIPMAWHDTWHATVPNGDEDYHFYSSLAGIPVAVPGTGNSSFTLESSFTVFDCEDLTQNSDSPSAEPQIISPYNGTTMNGSWYGHVRSERDREAFQTINWEIAVDRLVDPYWSEPMPVAGIDFDLSSLIRPAALENEVGIKAGLTRLLFRTISGKMSYRSSFSTACDIRMKYVESRVACANLGGSGHADCRVVEQRLSQKQHASELISYLSFPEVLDIISQQFPGGGGIVTDEYTDMALHYLTDPRMSTLDKQSPLQDVDRKTFGVRLSQLFNTYIIISQLQTSDYNQRAPGRKPEIAANTLSTSARIREATEVYSIDWAWMIVSIASCGVLFIGGLASVVLAHKTYGPDVLGYASTIVRGSKFMKSPPGTAWEDGIEVSRAMQHQRIRLGLTQADGVGKLQLGVSDESETERIKDALGKGKRGA